MSGGLFTEQRSLPIREYGHIAEANERIALRLSVSFGESYQALLRDGSFVLDSEAAAAGLAALRAQAPGEGVALIHALQRAFYMDGRSLSAPETYAAVALDFVCMGVSAPSRSAAMTTS